MSETMLKPSPSIGAERRRFLKNAGLAGVAGLGVLGAGHIAATTTPAQTINNDNDILNFALHLEYLEAEFYLRAVFGRGLADADTTGTGVRGAVTGGSQVNFATEAIRQYAVEVANDEEAHVRFIRTALAGAANARPRIDFAASFSAAAQAAGLGANFNPFADENSFLLGSFLFEDVGVTAYKGAAPLITSRAILEAAAGLLAVEAYHAGEIRTVLFNRGLGAQANAISDARDSLDGSTDLDQGILTADRQANIVPTDANGLAFSRTARQVLNIVFLNSNSSAMSGGFFPDGINLGRA